MKSVSIFLTLVFLTGFQAAVLSEEPPPPIPEPNQSILEQLQEQLGKVSTQVTNTVNGGLDKIKGHTTDFVAYTTDWGKRLSLPKSTNRKFHLILRDILGLSQSAVGQSKEALKDHYKKVMDMLEEMKKHPAMVALNEEMVNPLLKRCQGFANWMGDQSIASVTSMVQKKFSL